MDKLRKWRALSWPERAVFLQSLLALPLLALALRIWGFRRVYGVLLRSTPVADGDARPCSQPAVASLVRMVNAAANHGPVRATCLPRSLLVWWLLRRRGVLTDLIIGVRVYQGRFEAHAWVEREDVAVNDRQDVRQRFRPLERNGMAQPVHWV